MRNNFWENVSCVQISRIVPGTLLYQSCVSRRNKACLLFFLTSQWRGDRVPSEKKGVSKGHGRIECSIFFTLLWGSVGSGTCRSRLKITRALGAGWILSVCQSPLVLSKWSFFLFFKFAFVPCFEILGLFLALCLGIILESLWGTYEMLGINLRSALCKAGILILFWPKWRNSRGVWSLVRVLLSWLWSAGKKFLLAWEKSQ